MLPDDEIYYMIDKCRNGGTPDNAMMFLRVDDMGPRIQFKAKVKNRFGKIEYFYNCQFHDEFNPKATSAYVTMLMLLVLHLRKSLWLLLTKRHAHSAEK